MNFLKRHWEALAVGGGAGLIALLVFRGGKTTAVSSTSTTTPSGSSAGSKSYTLVSGQDAFEIQCLIGQTVTISLPAGASWLGQAPSTAGPVTPLTGSSPISWVFSGPGQIVWTWIDSAQMPQTTVGTFDLVPNSMGA